LHKHYTVVINEAFTVDNHPIDVDGFQDNRTGVPLGSTVNRTLNCSAKYIAPTNTPMIHILWIRDGNVIAEDSDHIFSSINNLHRALQIINFTQNDIGVYQCIFNTNTELMTTIPLRLQTGG
jgi:hypothetical protein